MGRGPPLLKLHAPAVVTYARSVPSCESASRDLRMQALSIHIPNRDSLFNQLAAAEEQNIPAASNSERMPMLEHADKAEFEAREAIVSICCHKTGHMSQNATSLRM
jgi:hypothetical protein